MNKNLTTPLTPARAKTLAAKHDCVLHWTPEFRTWMLYNPERSVYEGLEGSGGRYISSMELRTTMADTFTAWCYEANGKELS